MTTIPDTSTGAGQREASIMLARVMGWWNNMDTHNGVSYWVNDENGINLWYGKTPFPNLYDPANMALAWWVLNWANATKFGGDTTLDQWNWWHSFTADMRLLPPAAAQRAWLDKIISLALEAGMIEAQP